MHQWPIAVDADPQCTFFGIPAYVHDPSAAESHFVTLEEIAGEQWSQSLLSRLLPGGAAWAWWTRTEVFRRSGLATGRAFESIDPAALREVQAQRFFWRGMTLAFIPAADSETQQRVLYWAGVDTEQSADQLWVARADEQWQPSQMSAWCSDPTQWRQRRAAAAQPVQMLVIIFDSCFYCACPGQNAERVLAVLHGLAAQWQVQVVNDDAQRAWPNANAS